MLRLVIVLAVLATVAVAVLVVRRRPTDAPTGPTGVVPAQVDRGDFDRPEAEWLVAVFTEKRCLACAEAVAAARALEADPVAVHEVDLATEPALHRRYRIDAVPLIVIVDRSGVVRGSFIGPPGATRLWATMAEIRDTPRP